MVVSQAVLKRISLIPETLSLLVHPMRRILGSSKPLLASVTPFLFLSSLGGRGGINQLHLELEK